MRTSSLCLIALLILFNRYANAADLLWCRGTAFVSEVNHSVDIAVTFDSDSQSLNVYDISDDTEPWVPFKVVENNTIGDRDVIRAVIDGDNYPINVDPTGYDIHYEVEQVLGFPEMLYNFFGKIGGLSVQKTDLACKFE